MSTNKLYQAVFDPRSIALIGASGDEKKNTSRPQRYLKRHGYQGQLIPVNPPRAEIFGDKAWPAVLSIPREVDHAFVIVRTKAHVEFHPPLQHSSETVTNAVPRIGAARHGPSQQTACARFTPSNSD